MPYTLEDYREEIKRNVLASLTPEERIKGIPTEELANVFSADDLLKMFVIQKELKGLSTEELLKMFSTEEIENYIQKIRDKSD